MSNYIVVDRRKIDLVRRLVLLWQRKIELAKETRDQIDPNIGASEQKALTKDIQRMKNHLVTLK